LTALVGLGGFWFVLLANQLVEHAGQRFDFLLVSAKPNAASETALSGTQSEDFNESKPQSKPITPQASSCRSLISSMRAIGL